MSLATLKRKSKAKQNLSSNKLFSIKGVLRNIKGIGANIQINSDVRTIFKGISPSGCGGLPNQPDNGFPLHILGHCNYSSANKSVPTSTLTTKGLLLSRVYHPTNVKDCSTGCKKTWWVKNFNPLDHTQSEYMRILNVKKSANDDIKNESSDSSAPDCYNYKIGSRKNTTNTFNKNAHTGAMSSGNYNKINLLRNNCLPTPPCKQHFPFIIDKKNGCIPDFITPEDAIAAGFLPPDWLKCSTKYPTYHTYTINPYSC